jgi:hypothetical protein
MVRGTSVFAPAKMNYEIRGTGEEIGAAGL